MSDQLEAVLTRTLSTAAEAAPEPRADLLDTVGTRYQSRRRRRYATVAGLTAAAVIGVSAAVGGGAFTPYEPPADRPVVVGVPAVPAGDEPPVADVWPEAYHRLPSRLADGREYRVEAVIDDRRLLIAVEASFASGPGVRPDGEPGELWSLDLRAHQARRLVRLPAPAAESYAVGASHFAVGSGHIVWWDSYLRDGEPYTRIWKAPATGGVPVLVSTVTAPRLGASGDQLVVEGDAVHFSGGQEGGVRTVPLAGGEPVRLLGTEGHRILWWPWVGRLSASDRGAFTDLRNAETGERRDATLLDDMSHPVCSVTYCVGEVAGQPVASTRDGSRTVQLPGLLAANAGSPIRDRFVRLSVGDSGLPQLLYDIGSGRSGDLGLDADNDDTVYPIGPEEPAQRWFLWTTDGYLTYHLLDLAAIR